jgi:hypothetical protein
VLRELHASVARLVSPESGCEEFDLAHAIDALLIHESVGAARTRARQPALLTQAGNARAIARPARQRVRPAVRPQATH